MPSIQQMQAAPQPSPVDLNLPTAFPELPDDLKQKFPSLDQWSTDVKKWYESVSQSLTDSTTSISNVVNQNAASITSLQTQVDEQAFGAVVPGAIAVAGYVPGVDGGGNAIKVLTG